MIMQFNEKKVIQLLKTAGKTNDIRVKDLDQEYAYIATGHFAMRTKSKRIKMECELIGYRDSGMDHLLERLNTDPQCFATCTQLAVVIQKKVCQLFWLENETVSYIDKKYLDLVDSSLDARAIGNNYHLIKLGTDDTEWIVIAPVVFSPTKTEYAIYKHLYMKGKEGKVKMIEENLIQEFKEALREREEQKRKYKETEPNWEQYQYYLLMAAEEKVLALFREARANMLPLPSPAVRGQGEGGAKYRRK